MLLINQVAMYELSKNYLHSYVHHDVIYVFDVNHAKIMTVKLFILISLILVTFNIAMKSLMVVIGNCLCTFLIIYPVFLYSFTYRATAVFAKIENVEKSNG